MTDYTTQTVAQLKELLKGKGLPTDGKKADLVSRLTEADEQQQPEQQQSQGENESVVEDTTQTTVSEQVSTDGASSSAGADVGPEEESTLTVIQPVEKEQPKVLTAEERKSLAVELLKKKVSRAEKFGDEAGAEAARKDLIRVEKFGVELGTALAREIGLVDKSLGSGSGRRHNHHHNKFKKGGSKKFKHGKRH
ncbi:Protein THO1 [Spathaspora sp. JA1]|nr:Protein THO1 [Spathaspora sp. JA1]